MADSDDVATVSELGELAVIARATRGRTQPSSTVLGPGDDAAIVAAPDGRIVATTDMLVQDRHFRLDWSTPRDIGRKAIAQNGADVAAMGARPTGYLVSLGCPGSTAVTVTDGLTDGMWSEAAKTGAGIVGGDLVQSTDVVISVTALGDLDGRQPVLLSGAQVGDTVAVCGRLGWAAAGLALLRAGDPSSPELADAHRCPAPPYEQGPLAALAGATAMTDNSDGLLADLGHIAESSAVAIDIATDRIRIADELTTAASHLDVDVWEWVLTGGEDHALLATFPASEVPDGWAVIGSVSAGSGVTVDGQARQGSAGWQSFGN